LLYSSISPIRFPNPVTIKKAPLHLAARISDFEARYDEALKRLDAPLRIAHVKREKAAMSESKATTWNFPPLVLDEDAHRREWT